MKYARFVTIALSSALLSVAGCNGDSTADGGTDSGPGHDSSVADTGTSTDLGPDTGSTADAGGDAGGMLDAGGGDAGGPFDCIGATLPTTAPAMITISGTADNQGLGGPTPLVGVLVEAFGPTGTTPVTMMTSGAGGAFTLTLPTGGMPVDGYLRGTITGHKDTYVYSPVPMAADSSSGRVVMITPGVFGGLTGLAGQTQMDTNGFVVVLVEDCLGNPIGGATVTSTPAGTVRYNSSGLPSGTAMSTDVDGLAYIFNVPAGNVMVNAMSGTMALRGHMLNARAGAFTTTAIAP